MAMITATTSCSRSVDCAWYPLDALCACSGRWALKGWSAAFPGGRTGSRVCRYTQVQAMVAAPGEDVRMTENAHERVPAALQRLAASVAAPEALTVPGLRQRFGDSQGVEVAVGQLWRACWDDVAVLALLVDVQAAAVMVAPVTMDPPGEDENSLRSEEHTSELQSRPHLVCRLLLE